MGRGMKDSGIAWIGKIPADWNLMATKRLYRIESGATPKSDNHDFFEGNIPWITPADFKTDDIFVSCGRRNLTELGLNSCGTTLIPKGSIIFSKRAPIGAVVINEVELCTNQGCLSCIPKVSLEIKYFYYTMSIFTEQYNLLGAGTTFKEISATDFANFILPCPRLHVQQEIATYLDQKCARIDAVLERTRTSIEEYKKLKQAIITQAVTKGIRGDRPLKDSEVDWIGEIPVEWTLVKKLSNLCNGSISYGIVKLFEPDDEHGVKVLRCSDVLPGKILLNHVRTVKKEVSDMYARTILQGGEVVINVRGTLGGCAVVPQSLCGYNVAREVAVIPIGNSINNQFLMYYLLSDSFLNFEARHLLGSVYVGLNIALLSSCPIPCPPFIEQNEIIAHLNIECGKIDKMISKKEQLLGELESYKKSLIYECVTGKKEVI